MSATPSTDRIPTKSLHLVPQTREEARAYIAQMPPCDRAQVSPAWLALLDGSSAIDPWIHGFVMVSRETGNVIGRCGFKGPPDADGIVEIAYAVDAGHQGKGYASEAAAALMNYAFEHGQARIVRAHTLREANASTRVLMKCGFRRTGEVMDPDDGLVWRWEWSPLFDESRKVPVRHRLRPSSTGAAPADFAGYKNTVMGIAGTLVRSAGRTVAVLFIVLSGAGILGVWWADRLATDVALKTFGLVENGVGIVDAGVTRVNNLITTCRTEVRQAGDTMTAVGPRAEANTPVLTALNERLETTMAPRIAQMQQVMAPVRDAVAAIANALSFLNSFPGIAERAPRLAAMEDTFNRLEGLSADSKQLRATLRALVDAKTNDLTPETIATLNSLTQRIDTRLGEVESTIQGVQADVDALQLRLDTRKSRALSFFNLLAGIATLMLAWIIYSQVVVIQRHRPG